MNNHEYVLTEHDIIVTKTDLHGVITFVNEDLLRITGFTRDELIGFKHNIFRHPDMPADVFSDLWRTILSECTWSGIIKNKTKEGGFYWVQADVTPLYENDVLIGHMSVRRQPALQDIKRAELAYKQMKAGVFKGKLSFGSIVEKSFFHKIQRKFTNISVAIKLGILLSLSAFFILFLATINHNTLNTLNDYYQQRLAQIQSNTTKVYQTQLKQLHEDEIKIQELEDKIALLENFPLASSNRIKNQKVDTNLMDYFYEEKSQLNQNFIDIQSKNIFYVILILIALILLCEFIIRSILVPLKEATHVLTQVANGNYRVPIVYRSKNEIGRMMEALRSTSVRLGFDIANEKKTSAEIIQAYEKNQVLNHQVTQMQKVESLSRLTSGIAHDFNNILAVIVGYTQLNQFVADDCQDEKLKEDLLFNTNQIEIASARAMSLIKKMMLYSRQNPVDHEMEIKPTKQVIDEVLEMIKPALTSAFHLHAVIDCERDIQIDSIGLHQILTNLMVNARDAMRGIGGDIEVSLKIVTTHELLCSACSHNLEGHYIELRVTDNGTGIEDSVIENIFDPFFTTKPAGEGTGLGLSTVSGMVHDAQGHIIVESKTTEPNQGTAFRLLFPTLGNLP